MPNDVELPDLATLRVIFERLSADPVPALDRPCDECPYGPRAIVPPFHKLESFADLARENRYFTCHKATLQRRATACAGYITAHRELQALENLGLIYRIPESAIPQLPTEPGSKEERRSPV